MAAISTASVIADWFEPGAPCPWFDSLETDADARKEDDERVRRLGWQSSKTLLELLKYQELAERLGIHRNIPETLASKRYMRIVRANLTMMLKNLLDEVPGEPVYLVTLIPVGLACTTEELKNLDPKDLAQRVRVTLGLCGAKRGVAGWAFGYLDGEYNPATGMIQLHWHVIVTGDLLAAFERLKNRSAYRSVKRACDSPDGVATRVHIETVDDPQNTVSPRRISYMLKGSYYARWRGEIGDIGEGKRRSQKQRGRIPEPHHSRVLLWLDQWQVQDMTLLINLRLGKSGLYRM